MLLRFNKMHGLGNDFVVIDTLTQHVRLSTALIAQLADRKRGVGCDQVLVIDPPTEPDIDFNYRIFNADGSEVQQCGNGARCFARYVHDRQLTGKQQIRVKTVNRVLELTLEKSGLVTVDMGEPEFEPAQLPFTTEPAERYRLALADREVEISAVSMGNPHAVMLVDDLSSAPVAELGPQIEGHAQFPERVNAGFMQVVNRGEIALRVYERGVGETEACGSGACAAVAAGIRWGLLDSTVTVKLLRGELTISWPGPGAPLRMTGPAVNVYQGRIRL